MFGVLKLKNFFIDKCISPEENFFFFQYFPSVITPYHTHTQSSFAQCGALRDSVRLCALSMSAAAAAAIIATHSKNCFEHWTK